MPRKQDKKIRNPAFETYASYGLDAFWGASDSIGSQKHKIFLLPSVPFLAMHRHATVLVISIGFTYN
jgi:hypothetical protein